MDSILYLLLWTFFERSSSCCDGTLCNLNVDVQCQWIRDLVTGSAPLSHLFGTVFIESFSFIAVLKMYQDYSRGRAVPWP